MLEENKQEKKDIVLKTDFFTERFKEKELNAFNSGKKLTFVFSILTGMLLLLLIYLSLDISNIYHIAVKNNHYLSEKDIIALSGLKPNNKFYFFLPSSIESKISESTFIDSCKVERKDGNLVVIQVEEKKIIGYTFKEDKNVFIFDDDSRVDVSKENLYIISKVPLISGFSDEEIILLEKNLVDCDYQILNEVSDIINYPSLKYQNVEIIMRDGNYIFTSPYGLKVLNKYYSIEGSYKQDKQICYYYEDISGNAYTSACPWNIENSEPKEAE